MTRMASGSAILTDNWLLQSSAEVLEKSIDPSTQTAWLEIGSDGKICTPSISIGALQVLSLASLIEQIVFCNSMHVMSEWTFTWSGESKQLQALVAASIIQEFDSRADNLKLQNRTHEYQRAVCTTPAIAEAAMAADLAFRAGHYSFSSQVLNGSPSYLAQADLYNYCYSPHPIRARFLDQVLYKSSRAMDPRRRLDEIVNTARVKLSERVGHDSNVTSLISRMSSIAILCLRESSQQSLPILTALQLRDMDEFRRLRTSLHEMQHALSGDGERNVKTYLDKIKQFETAVTEVERRLRLRELGNSDGISEITVWKDVKLKVPDALRRPIIAPRHTTAISRLVTTATADIRRVLDRSLGISDPQVVEDIQSFLALADEAAS